jgi:hypothetical protein
MRRDYYIFVFEKFPDGSNLLRGFVFGRYEAQRTMQQLAEHSENEFFAIDIQVQELLPSSITSGPRPAAKAADNTAHGVNRVALQADS